MVYLYTYDYETLLRLGIFVGFASFFVMEKTLRVFSGEEGEGGHSHSHSHVGSNSSEAVSTSVVSTDKDGLRSRSDKSKVANGEMKQEHVSEPQKKTTAGPSKLSAYLNLFGDFVHNMYVPFFNRRE